MNRNKLKAYAPKARREFIRAVTDRAAVYGLTKKGNEPVVAQGDVGLIGGKPFPKDVVEKRKRLVERIEREGFEQVMEAMAYTWFNRFAAIRFMEVHGYLDHGYRVLSTTNHTNDTNKRDAGLPEILGYAEHVALPGVDRERVVELKLAGNRDEALYRMLLVGQCNALQQAMPFLFERIGDATELLLPDNLLHSDSLIRRMVNEVPEEEWQEVEILGWLYQFYISEKKDQVIGKVVKSEDIPAATQLFTPNWIVKYMVQNTIGRMWLATYPESRIRELMEYYIEPGEQTPEVMEQIRAMTPESLNPEEMTLADVACGSGHILVEGYDLFKAIYQERGYRAKDIPRLILEKNLYGLDIDDRAAQLAAFALMMKARADDRRIFDRGVRLNVMAIQNSPKLDDEALEVLTTPVEHSQASPGSTGQANEGERGVSAGVGDLRGLLELFEHGKTFGSLIRVPEELGAKLPVIAKRVEDVLANGEMFGKATAEALFPIVQQAMILIGNYEASATNPPYMGNKGMNSRLKNFAQSNYPISKSDLFAMFIERCLEMCRPSGLIGIITMQSWMFLSAYASLRHIFLEQATIVSMAHLGPRAFDSIGGEVVSTTVLVFQNRLCPDYKGGYLRLVEGSSEADKKFAALTAIRSPECNWLFRCSAADFKKIPGSPIAYWLSKKIIESFQSTTMLGDLVPVRGGMTTGDNDSFVRLWYEANISGLALHRAADKKKWFPYNKGGEYRKWFGNRLWIVDWENSGARIKATGKASVRSEELYLKEMVGWTDITGYGQLGVRFYGAGFIFDASGPAVFPSIETRASYILGFLGSKIASIILQALNSTIHVQAGNVASLPLLELKSTQLSVQDRNASALIDSGRNDWDEQEISWDFTQLPLCYGDHRHSGLKATYNRVRMNWIGVTREMQRLEEENNRIFIEAYGLQDELTPDVPLSEITLTCNPHYRYGPGKSEEELEALLRADTMKELVSYAVGCMMGRYSLDAPGLIYAHCGNDQFCEIYHEKHNQLPPSQTQNHSGSLADSPAPLNRVYPVEFGYDSGAHSTGVPSQGAQPGWLKFPPDADGIIPIIDTDWFPDDASNRFFLFISVAWPKEHLEENLQFIADSLSPNRGESPRETIRRYMATGFFKHHLKMYKKRPIYWLFSSGKLRAFQCLVYLHRYNEGTLSRMRTEYVIPLQGKISARIEQLAGDILAATSTAHRKKLEKERGSLIKQQAELQTFDEKLRHYADMRISLDLDDGVKVNYGKFGDLLAEVKAVTGKA